MNLQLYWWRKRYRRISTIDEALNRTEQVACLYAMRWDRRRIQMARHWLEVVDA